MKGFVVYPTYKIIDGKSYLYLYGRLENGESFLTINEFRPYFYIRKKDRKTLESVDTEIKYEIEETDFKNFYSDSVLKIIVDSPKDVPELRDSFHRKDILTYEADIRFVYRFFIDNDIRGSVEIEGNYEKDEHVDRLYKNPKIHGSNWFPKLKVMAIDIESSMNLKELYCISIACEDYKKVLIVSQEELKDAIPLKDEKELLTEFAKIVKELDPDIITGWNVIDFDLKVLRDKFTKYKISFNIGRSSEESRITTFDSFFKDSKAMIPGRIVLDGIHILRSSFIALRDYKLETAAQTILGEGKLDLFSNVDKGEEIERLFREEKQKLVDYNLLDSDLVLKILQKKNLIDITIQRTLLTGMQLDRVKSSIASLDNLYLSETKKRKIVCKTSEYKERVARIKGGYVKDSIPGIYDYIIVLDFKSLYPSIMRTFNIDPLMFIPKELHSKYDEKDVIVSPNGAWFRKEQGILPELLQTLWESRDSAKKRKDDTASYAIKITMNSFFGVLANPTCRFYSLDMANAITHFGQYIVKTTAEITEEMGYRVIYGDTDSIFVETKMDDQEKSEDLAKKIYKKINKHWQDYSKNIGVKSYIELQYEKTYVRFMMPKIRGTDIGAKKRYAGLKIVEGKEKIDFTGLEFVRRDWTDLAKKFQLDILDRIFHKKEVVEYVRDFVKDLRKGKLDDLLVYRKAIRKDLDDYTKTTPPHVKAARKLDKITSSIIAYVITTDGPEPVQKQKNKLDYEHYIEKQIKPIADSILVFYNTNFDDLIKSSKQTSLFGFS